MIITKITNIMTLSEFPAFQNKNPEIPKIRILKTY